jgi:apolipoprotein N-acyltransferase
MMQDPYQKWHDWLIVLIVLVMLLCWWQFRRLVGR